MRLEGGTAGLYAGGMPYCHGNRCFSYISYPGGEEGGLLYSMFVCHWWCMVGGDIWYGGYDRVVWKGLVRKGDGSVMMRWVRCFCSGWMI